MIPCNIDVVAEWTLRIGVHSDHRLIVELASAAGEVEEPHLRPGLATICRLGYRHLCSLNRSKEAIEEDDNVRVVDIAVRVKGNTGIRTKIGSICRSRRWQGQIHSTPCLASIAGEIPTHWQAEDFIRAADEYAGIAGVYRNRSLALRPVLIAHIDVWTNFDLACGCCLERY